MGEARERRVNGHEQPVLPTSGRPRTPKRIKVVGNIKIETVKDQGVVMMMLGDAEPELATALDPDNARKLARALLQHADQIAPESRIIMPGT